MSVARASGIAVTSSIADVPGEETASGKKDYHMKKSCRTQTYLGKQTDCSLFYKKVGEQIDEVSSAQGASYKTLGHHGPAVENLQMALRLYFNDSGAIDVYNKRQDGLELAAWKWYPSAEQQKAGAGCDEYYVGKTFGLGGIALMDNGELIRPMASGERLARCGKTRNGCYAEIISKAIQLSDGPVDLTLRIEVKDGSRWAVVKAEASRPVIFATGVNFPTGADVIAGNSLISVWGVHPADVSSNPKPIGAALRYNSRRFDGPFRDSNQIRIVSKKCRKIQTEVFSASAEQVQAFVRDIEVKGLEKGKAVLPSAGELEKTEGQPSAGDWNNYLDYKSRVF